MRVPIALLLSSHPVPAAAVTAVALTLALATSLEPWRVGVVTLAFAANQLSIGWSNDWIDADRDRASARRDKPVARGDVSIPAVRAAAVLAAVVAVILGFLLGPAAGVVHLVFVASAWAYNAGLKSTPLSVLPYIVSFGLLPAVVTLAAPQPHFATWWAVVAGALLGVAAHFTNVLPDLEDDSRTGVRGLPHRLGLRGAGISAFVALALGAVVVAIGTGGGVAGVAGCAVVLATAVAGSVLVLTRRISRRLFVLVLVAALVLVAMLAAGGTSLAA